MKTQLTTWLFLGVAAYVLLSAFHGCVDSKLEAEKRPATPPTTRPAAEPVEVRTPRPGTPVAPVRIGQGAAESLAFGQAADIPAASMHFPPLTAEEASSGPFAERMAAELADGILSSPLSMHMPSLFDDMTAAPEDDPAQADERLAGRAPDVAVLSARLERQRRTIAELKREIGVLRAAKEDLLDEVDQLRDQVAGQEEDQAAQPLAGPMERGESGDRDMENVQGAAGETTVAEARSEDCGCDEAAPVEFTPVE